MCNVYILKLFRDSVLEHCGKTTKEFIRGKLRTNVRSANELSPAFTTKMSHV